ncbi:MAG: hypothetical protein Q7R73_00620 [bacterium]|nr:hypothetical protein [bacterium]
MRVYREPEFESEAFFNHPTELLRKLEKRIGLSEGELELQAAESYISLSAVQTYTDSFIIYLRSRGIPKGYVLQRKNKVAQRPFPTVEEESKRRAVDEYESPSRFCGYAQIRV